MSDPRLPRALVTEALYPGNGLPPRPGEDRPALSPFGRLAMGQTLGGSTVLLYDPRVSEVQPGLNDMICIEGDDLDATQLIVTLHPPRVIPLACEEMRLDTQNLTGEQTNAEVTSCDFPGSKDPIRWPPIEALIEFGTGGVSTKVFVDYVNGVTLSVVASYLRVSALVTQNHDCGDISGTRAAYRLAAHAGPGSAESSAQRTIYVGDVDDDEASDVFDVPRFGKIASLVGTREDGSATPVQTVGWIRFYQDPKGDRGVGDFYVSGNQSRIEVPNAAQYFSVLNESGQEMKMSVIFKLAIR